MPTVLQIPAQLLACHACVGTLPIEQVALEATYQRRERQARNGSCTCQTSWADV
jgi:hypothetical protein